MLKAPELRVTVVGAGGAGRRQAEAAVQAGLKVAAVHDVDASAARELAARFGAQGSAGLSHALELARGGIAIVCTPPATHEPLAVEALDLGLGVLVEKPFAVSPDAVERVVQRARATRSVVAAVAQHRFAAGATAMRDVVRSGALGTVRSAAVVVARTRDLSRLRSGWRGDRAAAGGGVVMTVGFHYLDLLCWILGDAPATQVSVAARCADGLEHRLSGTFLLREVECSVDMEWGDVPAGEDELTLSGSGGNAALRGDRLVHDGTELASQPREELLRLQLRDLARAVLEGGAPAVAPSDVLPTIRLIDTLYRSAGLGGHA